MDTDLNALNSLIEDDLDGLPIQPGCTPIAFDPIDARLIFQKPDGSLLSVYAPSGRDSLGELYPDKIWSQILALHYGKLPLSHAS